MLILQVLEQNEDGRWKGYLVNAEVRVVFGSSFSKRWTGATFSDLNVSVTNLENAFQSYNLPVLPNKTDFTSVSPDTYKNSGALAFFYKKSECNSLSSSLSVKLSLLLLLFNDVYEYSYFVYRIPSCF